MNYQSFIKVCQESQEHPWHQLLLKYGYKPSSQSGSVYTRDDGSAFIARLRTSYGKHSWDIDHPRKFKQVSSGSTKASLEDHLKKLHGQIVEEAPISMYSKNFGFITTNGRVIRGVPEDELHASVARRLGFKGQLPEQKAIKAGLIRFAVGEEGDATFQYIPTKQTNKYVTNFIKKTIEIIGMVYLDLVRGGRVVRSEEWPVDKAIRFIPNI